MPNNAGWSVAGPRALQNVSLSLPGTASGSLTNGQTITLLGSGFGAVVQPLPVGEETFDQYANGLSGTLISALPSARFNVESSPYAVDYMLTDAVKLPGRKYGAVQSASGSAHTGTMKVVNGSFATHSCYATFWWRANEIITTPTQPATGSNKFIRIWDDFASGSGTRVSLTTQQNGTGGGGQFYAYMNSFDPDQITVDEWWGDTALHQTPNVWRRFEVYVDGNTGAAWFNLDGKRIITSTAFQKDPAYLGTVLQPALFGYDVGNSSVTSTLRTYLADLFSTQTAARVELSNSATFDQTTYQKRYYQRTLSRTDGQIQFEMFLGDLDVGNLYAHVLNSQGALIHTIPVTGLSNSVTVAHGDTVTITGSGFGTNAASLEFIGGADGVLETTTLGVTPSKAGWNMGTQWAIPVIQNDTERGKVAGATIVRANQWQMDMRFDSGAVIPENTYYYWSWWVKANVVDPGSPAQYQWKLGRVTFENSISDADTEITMFNWTGGAGKAFVVRRGSGDNTSYWVNEAQTFPRNNEWCRMELMVFTGTQGNANGTIHVVTNRPDGRYVHSRTNEEIYNAANRHRYFVLQNYFGNMDNGGSTSMPVMVDDVAIRVGSWKRVEIADNADLSLATVREIQPDTTWATGSVSVKINKGGLSNGTYWLHVVDGLSSSLGAKQVEIV